MFVWCFVFVILLGVGVSAQSDAQSLFYNAVVDADFQDSYSAGDMIDTVFTIHNNEDFPIVNAVFVVEILKGCETPTYPSQFSDCDNIFEEILIGDVNLPARSSTNVPFSYLLDSDLSSGTYRVDVALRTERTPIIGMPHILVSGQSYPFELQGTGKLPYAKILRTKTNIDNMTGPIGVGVDSGESFDLEVAIDSSRSQSATLEVAVCDWQDSICDPISVKTLNVNLVEGEKMFSVPLVAPSDSGAYALRIELNDGEGLVSLYRSRIIVFGEDARIRKIYTDNHYYNDNKMNVDVLVGGSPDHYNNPTMKDVSLTVSVQDLITENMVGSMTKKVGDLNVNNFFVDKEFVFDVSGRVYKFETCAKLSSGVGVVYDEYCYITDGTKFPLISHDVKLVENYNESIFDGSVCVYDPLTGAPTDSELFVSVGRKKVVVMQDRQVVNNCLDFQFDVEDGMSYNILVKDMRTEQDFNFMITKEQVFMGVSKNIWYYVVLTGLIILVLTILIITFVAKHRRELKKYE